MYSKRSYVMLILCLLVFVQVACSRFFADKKQDDKVTQAKIVDLSCLKTLAPKFQNFFNSVASEEEINASWDCIYSALDTFQNYTRGANSGYYTPDELRHFFNEYLLGDQKISEDFMQQMMKVKKIVVGGSELQIYPEDLVKFKTLVTHIKQESLSLSPYVKTLTFRAQLDMIHPEDEDLVGRAENQLNDSLKNILSAINFGHSNYSFVDAQKLIQEFLFFTSQKYLETKSENYLPVIKAAKNILLGHRINLDSPDDWIESANFLSQMYSFYLRFHYSVDLNDLTNPLRHRFVQESVLDAIDILTKVIDYRTAHVIPFKDLDDMIHLLYQNNMVKLAVKEETFKASYQKLVSRLLDSRSLNEKEDIIGIELRHLRVLKREFLIWLAAQESIDQAFTTANNLNINDVRTAVKAYDLGQFLKPYPDLTEEEKSKIKSGFKQWQKMLQSPNLIRFDQSQKVQINSAPVTQVNRRSLEMDNLIRVPIRLIFAGYSQDPVRAAGLEGITRDELQNLYEDFKPLGVEQGFMDPRSQSAGSRSFLEGNLFTPSSNGDNYLQMPEAMELVTGLISGGSIVYNQVVRMAHEAEHDLGVSCISDVPDVFSNPMIKSDCFRDILRNNAMILFSHAPGASQYIQSLSEADWNSFYQDLIRISGIDKDRKDLVESGEIKTALMILSYIENIFVRYDSDQSQTLSEAEALVAFPKFKEILAEKYNEGKADADKLSPKDDEYKLKKGFLYILENGQVPTKSQVVAFVVKDFLTDIEPVTRWKLLKVFDIIKSSTADTQANKSTPKKCTNAAVTRPPGRFAVPSTLQCQQ